MRMIESSGKMEVSLTVKDMRAVMFFVAAYAMAVLADNYICAEFSHRKASLSQPRRRVRALFFSSVVEDNDEVAFVFGIAYIYESVKRIKRACSHAVIECVAIFVLTNRYYSNLLSVLFHNKIQFLHKCRI